MITAKIGDINVTVYRYEGHIVWVKYPMYDRLIPVLDELIEVSYETE